MQSCVQKTHHHCMEPQTAWFCSAWRWRNITNKKQWAHQVNMFCSPAELWKGRPGCWLWRKETRHSCSHTSIHRSGCRCQILCTAEQQWEWRDALLTYPLFLFCVRDSSRHTERVWPHWAIFHCFFTEVRHCKALLFRFVLSAVGGLHCCLHESCVCWIRCAGVYVLAFREAYGAFSHCGPLSFKVKSCRTHQSPAFYGLKGCKHGKRGICALLWATVLRLWTHCVHVASGCG